MGLRISPSHAGGTFYFIQEGKESRAELQTRLYIRVPIISNFVIGHNALHLIPVLRRCSLLYSLTHACVSLALFFLCFSSCPCLFLSSTYFVPVEHVSVRCLELRAHLFQSLEFSFHPLLQQHLRILRTTTMSSALAI
jgi:hypothetical protein